MTIRYKFMGLGCGLLLTAGAALADAEAVVKRECADCHGMDGIGRDSDVPTIAGMSPLFLEEAMFAFRDRVRPCTKGPYRTGDTGRPEVDMCEVAEKLTDEEVKQVAEFYSGKPFVAAEQPFDPKLASIGKQIHDDLCEKCHAEGGASAKEDAGILAGQWKPYLEKAFKEYEQDLRWMPEKMKEKWDQIGPREREALLHFYASQQ